MLEEKEEKKTAKKTKNVHKECAHVRSKRSKGTGEKEATAEVRRKSKDGQGRKLSCKKVGYSKMHESATKPVTCRAYVWDTGEHCGRPEIKCWLDCL